jgi:NitT/TauT family transport system permease protein
MKRFLQGTVGVLVLLALGEVVGRLGIVRQEYLPPTSAVLSRLAGLLGQPDFLADVLATALAVVIALSIATVIAVPAGLVLGSLPGIRVAFRAITEFLRPIPSVALIPLALVVVGGGPETKIALAVYAAIWPILFNVIYALSEIEPQHIDTARSFNLSTVRIMRSVALPSAAPLAVAGIRVSAGICLIVVVSTELLAPGAGGIGQVIFDASSGAGQMDLVLAGTLVAGLLGVAVDGAFRWAQRRWLGWHTQNSELAR